MFTYQYSQSGNSEKEKAELTLKAQFRFKEEVAPKDRDKIWYRVQRAHNGWSQLDTYLEIIENISYDDTHEEYIDQKNIDKKRELKVSRHKFRLGFDLTVKRIDKKLILEEILNLEKLNTFILTGKQ